MKTFIQKYLFGAIITVFFVGIVVIWWQTRGYSDEIMNDIPKYDYNKVQSILADEDIQMMLEPSVFQYYIFHDEEKNAKDSENFYLSIHAADYNAISTNDS